MKTAKIHYISARPISHGAYFVTVEVIVDGDYLKFTKQLTDMELIDQQKDGNPVPLVENVTNFEYKIKR